MNIVGKGAEDIACNYLEGCGFEILERNWRFHHLEVDIIALERADCPIIHFVEVKGRAKSDAEDMTKLIGGRKRQNLINAANGYLKRKCIDCEVVFDLFFVLYSPSGYTLSFVRDAFRPVW